MDVSFTSLLRQNGALDDQVVNAFLRVVERRNSLTSSAWSVFGFDSFFHTAWTQGGYNRVRRWTKGVNIFERDLVVFPINLKEEFHWVLVAVWPKSQWIKAYDSLGKPRKDLTLDIMNYLEELAKDTLFDFEKELWMTQYQATAPQQKPQTNDCGVFLCRIAERLARQELVATRFDVVEYRRHIATVLRKSLLLKKTDFQEEGEEYLLEENKLSSLLWPELVVLPAERKPTSTVTVTTSDGTGTALTAWDPILEALSDAIDHDYPSPRCSVEFPSLPTSLTASSVHENDQMAASAPADGPNEGLDMELSSVSAGETPGPDEAATDADGYPTSEDEDAFHEVRRPRPLSPIPEEPPSPGLELHPSAVDMDWADYEDWGDLAVEPSVGTTSDLPATSVLGPSNSDQSPRVAEKRPSTTPDEEDVSRKISRKEVSTPGPERRPAAPEPPSAPVRAKRWRYRAKRKTYWFPDGSYVPVDVRKIPPQFQRE